MSDFLAEARVRVTPDTTRFRAELQAQLTAATKGVVVPVTIVPTVSSAATAAATQSAAATGAASAAEKERAEQQKVGAKAAKEAAKAEAEHARQLKQVQTASVAGAASLAGLRGAVLTAGTAFIATTVAIQAFSKAIQAAADLETSLNVFRVTARATADEMERVREQAVRLGADVRLPAVSAGDAAEAMNNLARAGLSVEDALVGARGVLQLATAAQIDNAQATEIAAGALNAFALGGEEATHVADLLATASNEAQGSISDMGLALQQSAAVANQVGLTIDETVAAITLLARAGLRGSDAGTSLRVALTRLIAPTKAARTELEKLNVDLRDSEGRLRLDIFAQLGDAMERLSRAERDRINVVIFGTDAQRAASILERARVDDLRALAEELDKTGAAQELAAARTEGFAGQVEGLKSNLETLGAEIGGVAIPVLGDLVSVIGDVSTALQFAAEKADEFEAALPGADGGEGGFFDELTRSLPSQAAELSDLVKVLGQFETVKFGELPSDALARLAAEAASLNTVLPETIGQIEELQKNFDPASTSSLNNFVRGLIEIRNELLEGGPAAQAVARELSEVIKIIQEGEKLPPVPIRLLIDPNSAANAAEAGRRTGESARSAVEQALAGEPIIEVGRQMMDFIIQGAKERATEGGPEIAQTLTLSINTQIAVAEAQGAPDSELLRLLREREANQAAFLARLLERPQTAKTQALVRKAAANLEATRNQIQSILDAQAAAAEQQANEAKAAASRAESAQREADQAFISLLTQRREVFETTRGAGVAATKQLQDDIRFQNNLQALIQQQIKKINETVKDEKLRTAAINALTLALIASENAEKRLLAQQAQNAAAQKDQIQELNIQIAEETGNEAALRRAINARIKTLNQQIKAAKGDQVLIKQLILERERLKNRLDDLSKVEEDNRKTAQEFFFEQLQAQQGFAANLLGNIIPSDMTAGLVGIPSPTPGTTGVGTGVAAAAAIKAGKEKGGPTAGQANTTNVILERILRAIQDLNRNADTPEAVNNKRAGSAVMDGIGGGSGSNVVM